MNQAAQPLSSKDEEFVSTLRLHATQHLGKSFAKFRDDPGGVSWTQLEDAMWAYQAIHRGGLSERELLMIVHTYPMPKWISQLVLQHKDDANDQTAS